MSNPIKKGDEITVGYEVRESRQMRLRFRQDWSGWTADQVVQLLEEGQLVQRGMAGGPVIALPMGDVVVADIVSDEAVDGGDYEAPRNFSLEDGGAMHVGDACPKVGCGGHLGQTTEDGLTCPECGLSWNNT